MCLLVVISRTFQELFRLLVHGEIDIPDGKASSSSVLVDLLAGGVAAARTNQVRLTTSKWILQAVYARRIRGQLNCSH